MPWPFDCLFNCAEGFIERSRKIYGQKKCADRRNHTHHFDEWIDEFIRGGSPCAARAAPALREIIPFEFFYVPRSFTLLIGFA
ncbi:MAG: hypothetical protein ACRD82_16480, partial [Blastocatellia bacterium]